MRTLFLALRHHALFVAVLSVAASPMTASAQHQHGAAMATPDTAAISKAVGLSGAYDKAEIVYKVSLARTDVKVTVDGAPMPPFMGLTSWVAFQPGHTANSAMIMGDLVLFEDEVNPVMSSLLDSGLQVTALHNHFFYTKPAVFFMHVGGDGNAAQLARGIRGAFDKIREIRAKNPEPASGFEHKPLAGESSLTAKEFEDVFHSTPAVANGMVKITVGRTATMDGQEVGKDMGINSWAGFMGTESLSEVDGDMVTTEGELQSVLGTLRHGGINIVAIHNHMEDETPRYVFLHYWGVGPAHELAVSVESAFEKLSSRQHAGM